MKLANGKIGCDNCGACFTCGTPKNQLGDKLLCPSCYAKATKK